MLAWIDVETTGLDPREDRLLEVACIVTDENLREVARYHAVTDEARYVRYVLDGHKCIAQVVLDMHCQNGLWGESLALGLPRLKVEQQLTAFLQTHAVISIFDIAKEIEQKILPQLAGSTVSFDRSFLEAHLPAAAKVLHYRNLDVTSLNELARRARPDIYELRPLGVARAHRAMSDIENSLEVARFYAEILRTAATRSPGVTP